MQFDAGGSAMLGMKVYAFGLLAFMVAGCGNDVNGTWRGSTRVEARGLSGTVHLTLDLEQEGNSVTGTALVEGLSGTGTEQVSGTAEDDTVSITLTAPGYAPTFYNAELDGDTMVGTLTEPGVSVALTLNR